MKNLDMIGFFWRGVLGRCTANYFTGQITVNDDESFTGRMVDEYGLANIFGRFVSPDEIEFVKIYQLGSSQIAAEGEIKYTMKADRIGISGDVLGGWKGTWSLESDEIGSMYIKDRNAICTLFNPV